LAIFTTNPKSTTSERLLKVPRNSLIAPAAKLPGDWSIMGRSLRLALLKLHATEEVVWTPMKQYGVLASHHADLLTGQAFSRHSFAAARCHGFE
jgi:hypothetical protein